MTSAWREQLDRDALMAERYAKRFPGWRRSSALNRCPRKIAGKRCLEWGQDLKDRCICQTEAGSRVLDHARLWIKPDGSKVLTAEPYRGAFDARDTSAFRAACQSLGLTVTVDEDSPYYPGSTLLVTIERAQMPCVQSRKSLSKQPILSTLEKINVAREHDYLLYIRLYCENSNCAVREIDIRCKDYDYILTSMPKGKPCCPVCRKESISCHYVHNLKQHEKEEETEARWSVNAQMYRRDTNSFTMSLEQLTDERLAPTPPGWFGEEHTAQTRATQTITTEDGMPKISIFIEGEDVSVVTDARDERDFTEGFTPAFAKLVAQNGKNPAGSSRAALTAAFDIISKMRGYKSNVQERRVLAAGRWPHPDEKPSAEAGIEDSSEPTE